jgi:hypothetical protein
MKGVPYSIQLEVGKVCAYVRRIFFLLSVIFCCIHCRWGETVSLNCIHKWAYYSSPRWYMSMGSHDGMILRVESRWIRKNPVPVPLCSPQIPHGLTWARTRSSTLRGRRLTRNRLLVCDTSFIHAQYFLLRFLLFQGDCSHEWTAKEQVADLGIWANLGSLPEFASSDTSRHLCCQVKCWEHSMAYVFKCCKFPSRPCRQEIVRTSNLRSKRSTPVRCDPLEKEAW